MLARYRILTPEDLSAHTSPSSCWISRKGKVYDITSFLPDHPGGDHLILRYAGGDIGGAMKDPAMHEHSEAAYRMLEDFVVGRLVTLQQVVSEGKCQCPVIAR